MQPIKCLLAVELEAAEIIKKNLEKVYKDEVAFYVCNNGKDLPRWGNADFDIVIVSRFLPKGEKNDKEFLGHLGLIFPSAHIILLAGTESEQRRVYLEIATQCGITDIVTGKLPGDRPHTIFEAINNAKERIIEGMGQPEEKLVWEGQEQSISTQQPSQKQQIQWQGTAILQETEANPKAVANMVTVGNMQNPMLHQWQEAQSQQASQRQLPQPQIDYSELGFRMGNAPVSEPRQTQQPYPQPPPQFGGVPSMQRQGVLVVPSANKGGVGKTTAGISLSVALAKMGVSTVLADYNFGGPNIASFFDVKDVPGIEVLGQRNIRPGTVADLLVEVRPNLQILPGPMDKTVPLFEAEQLAAIIQILQQMFSVVICDTPPEFWTKPWLSSIFSMADYVLAVVDQSKFSQEETKNFAPYMLAMGAKPENIRIVLNRFDPKLHNTRAVEKAFCSGFKKDVKPLPRVSVVIPNDWVAHVKKSYKGEVAGVDDEKFSQWHKLANEIVQKTGISVRPEEGKKKKGLLGGLFKKKK